MSAERAMLALLVIVFGFLGIKLAGDPMMDPVLRVILRILMWIYEVITGLIGAR